MTTTLGRYVHRVAITNRRILSLDDRGVTFRYKDSREQRWKTMTLSPVEFTHRFLQHVPPRGVHKVRYFGLFAPSNRHRLPALQAALTKKKGDEDRGASEEPKVETDPRPPPPTPAEMPRCALGLGLRHCALHPPRYAAFERPDTPQIKVRGEAKRLDLAPKLPHNPAIRPVRRL